MVFAPKGLFWAFSPWRALRQVLPSNLAAGTHIYQGSSWLRAY